jgi:hypothetical protein
MAVPVETTPPVTLDGESVIPVNACGETVSVCCCEEEPMAAVMVDVAGPAIALIVNVALFCEAGTVTVVGTVAAAILELVRFTGCPPAGADPLKVTVPVHERPAKTGFGVRFRLVTASRTVNMAVLVAVPPGVVTEIVPVVAPVGTVAVTVVEFTGVMAVAAVPLKRTAVAPERLAPVIVTDVPTGPDSGAKLEIVGVGFTVTTTLLVAVKPPASLIVAVNV